MTSAKKMFGDLPPSSTVDGIRFWAAYCMISRPVPESPVKPILAIRGLGSTSQPTPPPVPRSGPSVPKITPKDTSWPLSGTARNQPPERAFPVGRLVGAGGRR
jgi:hypothetical protein